MGRIDRRDFLKTGALGAAGLSLTEAGAAPAPRVKAWNVGVDRALRKFRNPAPTVCRMCPAHCGLVAFRDGDRVVQVQGSEGAPTNRGGICSRGLSGLERLYDPERQLHPLRRKGPRGSGTWERISWESALNELQAKLHAPEARKVLHLGQEELLVQELRDVYQWTHLFVDRPFPGRPGPGSGTPWYGSPLEQPGASRARTVFLFGLQPYDGRFSVPLGKDLVEAQRGGAAVHYFGPFEGATGSLTTWHPVAPGTEGVVALGIAKLLLQWGRLDAGAFGRGTGVPPAEVETVLAGMSTEFEAFTPEKVEEISGVPAAQIVYLARRFAEERPALALAEPSSAAAPAAALLNHLVGSVDVPGGAITARGPFFVKALQPTGSAALWLQRLSKDEENADVYWVCDTNPVYDAPDSARVAEFLADPDRVGFTVVMDTHLTETAHLADLFLPLATHFESWGLVEGSMPDGRSYLYLQQPVTQPATESQKLRDPKTPHLALFEQWARPLGESRGLPDLLLSMLGDRAPRYGRFADTREYLGELLRKSWGPGSLEALQARGIWVSEEGRPPHKPAAVQLLEALPKTTEPPALDQLWLVMLEPGNLPQTYANTRFGREIEHRSQAFLHPATAKRLGIADGDRVTLRTGTATAHTTARVIQGLHPNAIAVPDGFGHGAGAVATAAPPAERSGTRTAFLRSAFGLAETGPQEGQPIWWSDAGPGFSVRSLFPFRDGLDGLQDWGPLPVTVEPA